MIKKLTNDNQKEVLEMLYIEPSYNLFFIGDIENYGCEDENVELWGEYANGKLSGVLLRYFTSVMVYYNYENFNPTPFKEIIKGLPQEIEILSGKPNIMECFADVYPNAKLAKMYFCELQDTVSLKGLNTDDIKIATVDDAQKICDLQNTIEEFSTKVTQERVMERIKNEEGRIYLVEDDDKAISMAQTTAENSKSAMIIGVCTDINYRKQGLMRKVMTKLCYDLQQENKTACLFYDNKEAGRIYHSIGFETIGIWYMYRI